MESLKPPYRVGVSSHDQHLVVPQTAYSYMTRRVIALQLAVHEMHHHHYHSYTKRDVASGRNEPLQGVVLRGAARRVSK